MRKLRSLSGLSAQQWKNYAWYYARPCLLDLLPVKAYQSIKLLCEIIEIVVKNVLTPTDIARLEQLLHDHHQLFSSVYGKWKVSINYHMVLHITDMFRDYGPAPVFWCFAFERLNGLIVDAPSNNRSVEVQLTEAFLFSKEMERLGQSTIFPGEIKDKVTQKPALEQLMSPEQDSSSTGDERLFAA